MEYFEAYAEHFNLREHIKFNTQVLSIKPVEPVSENWTQAPQTWLVKYTPNRDNTPLYLKDKIDQNEAIAEEFDAVMVCTGHHTVPVSIELT
jgi:cation diffusion facilitator CzcD-associated flavoprotein CzcO